MHTILGAGGAIANELAKALPAYTSKIRLVSRHPKKVNPTDELLSADLMIPEQVQRAVAGSEVAYLTVGLPYQHKVWAEKWPPIVRNVLDACHKHQCKLVFVDNVYLYAPDQVHNMTEESKIGPISRKGKTREYIYQMILSDMQAGKVEATIARSADFYGPNLDRNSFLIQSVFDPIAKGKTANWMGRLDLPHSFTYTPDAGKALAILGHSDQSWGQTWHLPTASDPPTGEEMIRMVGSALSKPIKFRTAGKVMLKLIGFFVPIMREMPEMLYQYNQAYIFKSDKFNQQYSFEPTPYTKAIKEIVAADYTNE